MILTRDTQRMECMSQTRDIVRGVRTEAQVENHTSQWRLKILVRRRGIAIYKQKQETVINLALLGEKKGHYRDYQ
jgi:hypothetical protein